MDTLAYGHYLLRDSTLTQTDLNRFVNDIGVDQQVAFSCKFNFNFNSTLLLEWSIVQLSCTVIICISFLNTSGAICTLKGLDK